MPQAQIEMMTRQKPILTPVSPAEAARLSPWPDRIAGRTSWEKPERCREDNDREYDRRLYGDLCARWEDFVADRAVGQRHPGIVPVFLDKVRRGRYAEILENRAVYGAVDLDAYLVSIADRLYAAEIGSFELLVRGLVVERTARARAEVPFDSIVEIGSGNGTNLVNLYLHLGLASIGGNDLSPNAVGFLRRVAGDVGIDGAFAAGDCRDVSALAGIAPGSRRWALLSVHAVQMIDTLGVEWFERLVALDNPPRLGIHFEPVVWVDDETPFARQCARYARLNRYNLDFLETVRAAESQGVVRIMHVEKRIVGASAFAPTTLLVWTPAVR